MPREMQGASQVMENRTKRLIKVLPPLVLVSSQSDFPQQEQFQLL